jgi:YfiH family protein
LHNWYRADFGEVAVHQAWNLKRTGLVDHCFSTRLGGFSDPPRDGLNLGNHVKDDPKVVTENRRLLMATLGLNSSSMTCAEQVHGNKVAVVTGSDAGRGATGFSGSIPGADALITNSTTPVLTLFFADCVPVFILHPVNKAIGLAHAGWKGTALRIAAETVAAMSGEFGTDPSKCIAAIGPAIGRCCYDVSEDVATRILEAAGDDRVLARACQETPRVDLKLANWLILRSSGIPEANIAVSSHCTACESDDFFSYRRDGVTGRMAAVLKLR